jgi:DNA uptake protein ComE-like DNA-binding protein
MTPRTPVFRAFVSLLVLSSSLLAAACSPGAEKAPANTAATNTNSAANTSATPAATPAAAPGASKAKLNVNTASREEFLAAVPNLGNKMAHEFEEYRPYKSIQQFRKEISKYVAPAKVAEYERYVFVPINENDSDAATLQQIPGLDATEAAALVAGRPYASREVFLAKLSEKVSVDELAAARTYLGAK